MLSPLNFRVYRVDLLVIFEHLGLQCPPHLPEPVAPLMPEAA